MSVLLFLVALLVPLLARVGLALLSLAVRRLRRTPAIDGYSLCWPVAMTRMYHESGVQVWTLDGRPLATFRVIYRLPDEFYLQIVDSYRWPNRIIIREGYRGVNMNQVALTGKDDWEQMSRFLAEVDVRLLTTPPNQSSILAPLHRSNQQLIWGRCQPVSAPYFDNRHQLQESILQEALLQWTKQPTPQFLQHEKVS